MYNFDLVLQFVFTHENICQPLNIHVLAWYLYELSDDFQLIFIEISRLGVVETGWMTSGHQK